MTKLACLAVVAACGGGSSGPPNQSIDAVVPDVTIDPDSPLPPDGPPPEFAFTKTAVGTPAWDVGEIIQFSTAVGVIADNLADSHTTFKILIPDHVYNATENIWTVETAHQPPYDVEMTSHLPNAAFKTGASFALADWSPRNGICIAMVMFPKATAPTGVTPDGTLPMIPNTVLPLNNGADLFRDNVIVDPNFDGFYPVSTVWAPNTDGYSHIPLFFCETTEFLTPATSTGTYTWTVTLRDTTNAGYNFTAGPLIIE